MCIRDRLERPDTLTDDIAAIDYVLKLCGFNEDPQQYMPERRKKQIFAKGEKRRLVMEVLPSLVLLWVEWVCFLSS